MSIDVQRAEMDMSGRVAEEIRALLARRRMSGRELARVLDVSPSWVSYRLTGTQPIDVNDLQKIARVLGVRIVDLLPIDEIVEDADKRKRRFPAFIPEPRRPLDHPAEVRVTGTQPHPGHPLLAGAVSVRASRNPAPPGPRRTNLTGR